MELTRLVPLLVTVAVLAATYGGAAQGANAPSKGGTAAAGVSASPVPAAMDQVDNDGGVTVKATWAVVDPPPLLGLSVAAGFLNEFKTPLLVVGFGMNAVAIVVNARELRRARRACSAVGAGA